MGILDVFRSKKEEPVKEITYTIDLDGMQQWLDDQFGNQSEEAKKRAMRMGSEALESISSLKDRLNRLEKSSFGGKDKAYAAANMAKNSFVKKTFSIIEGLRFSGPGKETYSGLLEFNSNLREALKQINKISPKQMYLLSRYFKQESRNFMASLREMEEKTKAMSDFLSSDGKIISTTEKAIFKTKQMKGLLDKLAGLKNQQRSIEAEITRLEGSKKQTKLELESFMGGKEWRELSNAEDSIAKNKQELSAIETDANEALSSAKRPLKKLMHMLDSKESFPENPFKEIVMTGREAWLAGMLKSAKDHSNDGSISLKPREADRLQEVSDWMETDMINAKQRYEQLLQETDELHQNMANLDIKEKKASIENQLRETEEALKKQWVELDMKIKQFKETESKLELIRVGTESLFLDNEGKKVKLQIPKKSQEDHAQQSE